MVRSMVRTFLVPRALQAHLSRAVFVLVRRVFRLRASERHDYAMRDRVMALYAPVALLIAARGLVLAPAARLLGDVLRARRGQPVGGVHAGGLLDVDPWVRAAARPTPASSSAFTAAGLGLVLLALFITYLPSLYGAFQRRERGVAKLEVRAGQPPTGVYLIELAWTVGRLENLAPCGPSGRTGSPTWTRATARSRRSCSSAPPTRISPGSRPPARSWTGRPCSPRRSTSPASPNPSS